MLVVLGHHMLHQGVNEVGRLHDVRLRDHRHGLSRSHQVVGVDRQRACQLVDGGEVGSGNCEGFTHQPAQQMAPVADRDDQVPDLGAVVAELRLVDQGRRRRVRHHLTSPEVLHQQAEIALGQARRNLVAVRRIGGQRDAGSGREILHRGPRHIVINDVGEPDGGCFSSQ